MTQSQSDSQDDAASTHALDPVPGAVDLLYPEICRSHAGIAEFRARLLALLPLASGGGVFLLLNNTDTGPTLTAAGVFGFVVTFGLFMYELRGIEDCVMLRARAEFMEDRWLHVAPAGGHYRCRIPGRLHGLVSELGAGWIVYTAVMTSWLYVAGRGAGLDERLFRGWPWVLAGVGALVVALGVRLWDPRRGQEPMRKSMYRIFTTFDVPATRREEFVAAALKDSRESRATERGTRRFELIEDRHTANRFHLDEAYDDERAFDVHRSGEPYKTFLEAFGTFAADACPGVEGTEIDDAAGSRARRAHSSE